MNGYNKKIGAEGEAVACRYLKRRGYRILDRNFTIRGGELDIIAMDGNELVFAEVKTRTSDVMGHPSDAVNNLKKKNIIHTARIYISKKKLYDIQVRFDVLEVVCGKGLFGKYKVNHIKDAFGV